MIDKIVELHMGTRAPAPIIGCTEGDTMWRWHFRLFLNEERWTIPAGSVVMFTGKKADGNVFDLVATLADNEIVADAEEQVTAAIGPVAAVVRVIDTSGKIVASCPLVLAVRPNPQTQGPMSETVLSAYNDVLSQFADLLAQLGELPDNIPGMVSDWLAAHVDPETGYVLDTGLTIAGAAADAKATGDAVAALNNKISKISESANLFWLESQEIDGATVIKNSDGTYTINGTVSQADAMSAPLTFAPGDYEAMVSVVSGSKAGSASVSIRYTPVDGSQSAYFSWASDFASGVVKQRTFDESTHVVLSLGTGTYNNYTLQLTAAGITALDKVARETAEDAAAGVAASAAQIETNRQNIAVLRADVDDKAPVITDTASGAIASFSDGADGLPVKKLTVKIEPVQDLHGYDRPWPAGGGKNLLNITKGSATFGGLTFTVNQNSAGVPVSVSVQGVNNTYDTIFALNGEAGTFAIPKGPSFIVTGGSDDVYVEGVYANTAQGVIEYKPSMKGRPSEAFTIPDGYTSSYVQLRVPGTSDPQAAVDTTIYPMLCLADETDLSFEPYSNICPISGWTGANVMVSPTQDAQDAQDGTAYPIDWKTEAGTVYRCRLDLVTGVLTLTSKRYELTDPELECSYRANYQIFRFTIPGDPIGAETGYPDLCTCYKTFYPASGALAAVPDMTFVSRWANLGATRFGIKDTRYTDVNTFLSSLSGQYVVVTIPDVQIQLSPQEVKTLLGVNHIRADCGEVVVTYLADTRLYIDQKIAAAVAALNGGEGT